MADPRLNLYQKLSAVQLELKAPKGKIARNKNGAQMYTYRSAEDILDAAKPILSNHGLVVTISDYLHETKDDIYIRADAIVFDIETGTSHTVSAYACEPPPSERMNPSQATGSTSSYARKYALNGLFCLDDNKDADTDEFRDHNDNRGGTRISPAPGYGQNNPPPPFIPPTQQPRQIRPNPEDITTPTLSKQDQEKTSGGASWKSLRLLYGETKRLGMLTPPDNNGEMHHDESWLMQQAYEMFEDPNVLHSEDLSQQQVSNLIDDFKMQSRPSDEERHPGLSPAAYQTADQRKSSNGAVPNFTSWQQFWPWAKSTYGIDGGPAYENLVGRKNTSMEPNEAAQALIDAFAQPHLARNVVG